MHSKTPFLKQVAQQIIQHHKDELDDVLLIFPTDRNGLFFKKYFEEAIAEGAFWLPQITTLDTFLSKLSNLNKQDSLAQVVILHQHYQELMEGKGFSLDKFFGWANILLDDFNQIDTYLADTSQVFKLIKDEKEIDELFKDFLEEEQIEFLKEFWAAIARKLPKKAGSEEEAEEQEAEKANFLKFWSIIPALYEKFTASVEAQNAGTLGLIRRRGYEKLTTKKVTLPAKHIYLVGFQMLEPASFKAFELLIAEYDAKVIWNLGLWYNKKANGSFSDPYLKAFLKSESIASTLPPDFLDGSLNNERLPQTAIRLYEGTFPIDEVKIAGQLLEEIAKTMQNEPDEEVANVAVVLTDSSLLAPLLSSIPDFFKKLNVTTTFAFKETSLNIWLQLLSEVLLEIFKAEEEERDLKQQLQNTNINNSLPTDAPELFGSEKIEVKKELAYRIVGNASFPWFSKNGKFLLEQWSGNNTQSVVEGSWGTEDNLQAFAAILHSKPKSVEQVWEWYLMQCNLLADCMGLADENSPIYVERQYLYSAITTIVKLRDTVSRLPKDILTKAQVVNLIKETLQYSSLAFTGDPIEGLQVMGLFETQNLQFQKVILLGANEGNLPPRFSSLNSFIPFSIRKAFKLQLPELQDSRYKNLFYSLIDNAQEVFVLYALGQNEVGESEPSRFLNQLKYLYKDLNIISPGADALANVPATFDYSPMEAIKIEIPKTPEILSKLDKYYNEVGKSAFSNSSLGTFITCSLKFYFSRILNLQIQKEYSADLETEVMGTVVHNCLQNLYTPFVGKTITALDFKQLEKQVDSEVDSLIRAAKNLGNQAITDRLILSKEMAIAFVKRVLAFDKFWLDKKTQQLELLALEQTLSIELPLEIRNVQGQQELIKVRITGNLDRIDKTDAGLRILDYKTGSDRLDFAVSFDEMFQGADYKQVKAFQVMLYALLYFESNKNESNPIEVGLLPIRALFGKTTFNDVYNYKAIEGDNSKFIGIELVEAFKTILKEKIQELYNPLEPFKQTENLKACTYCEYVNICGRKHLL